MIDLDKYPIDKPDSTAYDDLIEFCHAQLKRFGSVDLPGFIREEVLQKMAEEVCWHQNSIKNTRFVFKDIGRLTIYPHTTD